MPVRGFVRRRRRYARPIKRKVVRRRTYRRRIRGSSLTKVRPIGVADGVYVKLRWSGRGSGGANGVALENIQYRGNGPYDPAVAAGGTSCSFWGQYATLYKRYICFGSKIEVTFMGQGTINTYNIISAVYPASASESITETDILQILERRRVKYRIHGTSGSGDTIKRIKHYAKTKTIVGCTNGAVRDNEDRYGSSVTTVPQQEWYWNVLMQNQDEANNTAVAYIVRITYYCKFYNPAIYQAS